MPLTSIIRETVNVPSRGTSDRPLIRLWSIPVLNFWTPEKQGKTEISLMFRPCTPIKLDFSCLPPHASICREIYGNVGVQAYKGSIGSTKIWSLAAERRRCSRLEWARISNLRISMDVDGCVGLERYNAQSLVTIPRALGRLFGQMAP